MNDEVESIKQKLAKGFLSLGYSPDQIEKQISDLGQVISQSILMRIINEHSDQKDKIISDTNAFIKSNYSDEEFNKIVEEEVLNVAREYLEKITEGMDQKKKDKFLSAIKI